MKCTPSTDKRAGTEVLQGNPVSVPESAAKGDATLSLDRRMEQMKHWATMYRKWDSRISFLSIGGLDDKSVAPHTSGRVKLVYDD